VPGIAVIGCGYWGPKVARNFASLTAATHRPEACELRALCDIDRDRLESAHAGFPDCRAHLDAQAVFDSPDIDAVAICTPIDTHFELTRRALEAGKHVFVEKPLTHSVLEAEELVALARARDRVLLVDHTFIYGPASRVIKESIDSGELGELLYIDTVRVNLGVFHPNVSVLWDLAVHDVSTITHFVDRAPLWVSAVGSSHYGAVENIAYITIMYPNELIAHVNVNWLAPVKSRTTVIGGAKRMLVYDDLAPNEKLRIYDKGVEVPQPKGTSRASGASGSGPFDYRVGETTAPAFDEVEPLACVCRDFVRATTTGRPPAADGEAGLAVVRLLAAAEQSIRKNGERVAIEPA